MNTFQKTLKKQIVVFGLWLTVIFSLIFVFVLFVYSLFYNSYRARKYNELLAAEFDEVYKSYSSYLDKSDDSDSQFLRCLSGKISGNSLAFIFNDFSRKSKVSSNMILTNNDGDVVSSTYRELTVSQISFNKRVVENTKSQDGIYNTVYYFDDAPRYVFAKKLNDDDGSLLGVICLYLNMDDLTEKIDALQYGGIIVHNVSDVVMASDRFMVQKLNHFYGIPDGTFKNNGKTYSICSSILPQYDVKVYTYVAVVPVWGYYLICCLLMLGILLCIGIFSLNFARRVAQHSAASVELFHQEIDSVTSNALEGDGSKRICLKTGDEFEDIALHINAMLESINELSERNMELLRFNKTMEMRTLEAQFNPHFLYNTLESIRFAIQLGIDGTGDIIRNLTKLLRYSIDSSKTEVTLSEDLSFLLGYLEIIKFRFGGRFTYSMDISDGCGECLIPKLILQPILENSIKYGFQSHEKVNVVITGYTKGGFLYLTVQDDGIGMDEERLDYVKRLINNPLDTQELTGHYELQNTSRRLQLQCGEGSTMEISSTYGVGTTVTLCILERRKPDV